MAQALEHDSRTAVADIDLGIFKREYGCITQFLAHFRLYLAVRQGSKLFSMQ